MITICKENVAAILSLIGICSLPGQAYANFQCNTQSGGALAPYSASKFQSALQRMKLQLPTSSTCITQTNIVNGYYDPDNWYLDNTNIQFDIDGGSSSQRNELRGDSFSGSSTNMEFSSRLKVKYGAGYSDRFTVAQIYGQDGNKPILRVEFLASRDGKSNHLWGVYRTSAGWFPGFEYKDLGPAPTGFTTLNMVYNDNGTVKAQLGGNAEQTWSTNFSEYDQSWKQTYFKVGCYLQDPGDCYVRLSTLNFDS